MENTKAKNIVITILVILLLCCLGFVAWQYMQLNDNKAPEVSTQDGANTENKVEELKREDLDINSELVQKLYGYVPYMLEKYSNDGQKTELYDAAYQNKKITINELSNESILFSAFNENDINDEQKVDYIRDGENMGKDDWFAFEASILQETVKEQYGQYVPNVSFDAYGRGCFYYDNLYGYGYGGGGNFPTPIREITKAYKKSNELYIEDVLLIFETYQQDEEAEESDYIVNIYTSCDVNSRIKQLIMKEDDVWNEHYDHEENLFKQYENQAQKYKHTFKLSEEGTYYWYSTEPID